MGEANEETQTLILEGGPRKYIRHTARNASSPVSP